MKKIILLGYMGCGKSTIAKELSKKIAVPFIDLDEFIEKKVKMDIKTIFAEKGEIHFRKLEHECFVELLNLTEPVIIGLGGGTPCYANNHELLKREDVLSVYLKASIDTLVSRLSLNKSNRPLIANKNDVEMKEFIATHLFERSYYYNQAQYSVAVDEQTIEQTVGEILAILA
ncbi:shikimate kinase [Flavobacterium sp. L1I52]|uniref:Shikimate kinase n=1 Tax=Flavobacterium pokkalii TaxID=1940408 RepID=A0ABR7UQZ0_9FLAO|nr:shikimate kinase [Flavobacterium pokkalii]MBD0724415.1 shikimate kinase [Flavobacterium pokkalii]